MQRPYARTLVAASALALLAGGANAASGTAAYPQKPVRIIVPFAPQGPNDILARLVGQQFVIDNRPGASGTIGAATVARAAPDGYTLLHDATAHSVNPSLFKTLPYDTGKDFQPVFLAVIVPNLLVVTPSVPVRTVPEIIELAKSTPGGLDWASSGNGTAQHLALELFRQMAGITLTHVPYKGGALALTDVMGGHVKFYFSNATASTGHVKSGKIRAIAHTGRGRLAVFPDLPAMEETLPGYECLEWNGVFAPAGTSAEIVQRLNAGLNDVIKQPEAAERLAGLNAETRANTPEQFGAFVASEIAKWGKVVRDGNIQPEG